MDIINSKRNIKGGTKGYFPKCIFNMQTWKLFWCFHWKIYNLLTFHS